jgi:hypothetical protein
LFRHVLRLSVLRFFQPHPSRVSATTYELDVNGLNYDAAKKLDQ